jgi:hypothetical protein
MTKTEAKIEAALVELKAAESAHDAMVASKFAAIGKTVGMFAPELDRDADLAKTFERAQRAARVYSRVCR